MESNSTPQPFKTESDSQLPNDLINWIKNEFPERTITYRNKEFIFYSDVPIDAMEEVGLSGAVGVARIKLLLKALSISPKITDEVLEVMGSGMLMGLHGLLFPKSDPEDPKADPSSQPETTKSISSAL